MIETIYRMQARPPYGSDQQPFEVVTFDEAEFKTKVDFWREKGWSVRAEYGRLSWYPFRHLSREEY